MEHPFAHFIKILGKGKRGARDLSQQEAEQAMGMILSGQVEPVQLGAFLMLMRVKEETPEEIAGFVGAARHALRRPPDFPGVDLDWSSYAGKRRQLPWSLLSSLLLASHGIAVLMHGVEGGNPGRMYLTDALRALGIEVSHTLEKAAAEIRRIHFAFVPLKIFSAELDALLNLKPLLGLRSPIHSAVRMLNPLRAPASIMGIFHPGYDNTHQHAAMLLNDPNTAVFKGEGGEAERNPDGPCRVRMFLSGQMMEEVWPAYFDSRHMKDSAMDANRLLQLWRGDIEDEYGLASVIGTAAVALRIAGRAATMAEAEGMAARLWDTRNPAWFDKMDR